MERVFKQEAVENIMLHLTVFMTGNTTTGGYTYYLSATTYMYIDHNVNMHAQTLNTTIHQPIMHSDRCIDKQLLYFASSHKNHWQTLKSLSLSFITSTLITPTSSLTHTHTMAAQSCCYETLNCNLIKQFNYYLYTLICIRPHIFNIQLCMHACMCIILS